MKFFSEAKQRWWRRSLGLGALGVLLPWVSCAPVETVAPEVTGELVARAAPGVDQALLIQGRAIYLNQCTACHVAEPVTRYTPTQWDDILPRMIVKTGLTPAQERAVTAYVRACLK